MERTTTPVPPHMDSAWHDTALRSSGFLRIVTPHDSGCLGYWVNPALRKIVSYCEGDQITESYDSDETLVRGLERISEFYTDLEGAGITIEIPQALSPELRGLISKFIDE